MTEDRFELTGYFKMETGKLVPFSLEIAKDTLTISARTRKDKEPYPESLAVIKTIDEFLHKTLAHQASAECEQPEKIVFLLR